MSGDGKGQVGLLLNAEPWLALIDAEGKLAQIPVHSALAWAGRVWAAPNGTFVALSKKSQVGLQFQRFDLDGSLVGSGSWNGDPKATLVAAAPRPDGRLALVLSSGTTHSLLTLSADDELKVTGTLASTSAGEIGCCNSPPESLAVTPAGEYLLAGNTQPEKDLWWAKIDASGKALGNQLIEGNSFSQSPVRVVANVGGQFGAFTDSDVVSGVGATSVIRFGQKLDQVWHVTSPSDRWLVQDMVALPDSVLVASRTVQAGGVVRYDRDGKSVAVSSSNHDAELRLVAARDYDVVLLEQSPDAATTGFTLTGLRLSALPVEGSASGSSCELDADCESAQCCFQGSDHVGKCGDVAGCELNEQCVHDSDCASGKCLLGVAVCTVPCSQSKDCPANSYCAEACSVIPCVSVCLPECLGKSASYCPSLGSWTCQMTKNTEDVEVSLCQP
jgi:hypothetical protein